MAETVYVSAGSARYHRTPDCRALESMQLLNEDMGGMWVPGAPYAVSHAFLPVAIEQAAKDGKTPCSSCKPPLAAADNFGHEPVTKSPGFLGETPDGAVCARCWRTVRTWGSYTVGYDERSGVQWENGWVYHTESVPWPCTSAVVLGLTPREVTA